MNGRLPSQHGGDRRPVTVRWIVHNLVAHPLLVLWPPVGEWLHGRTVEPM